MSNDIRQRIERRFEDMTRAIGRRPWLTVAVMLLATLALGTQMRHLRLDLSNEGFLHENDPTIIEYDAFRDQFGRDEVIIVALQPPEVFDLGFLRKLERIHEELAAEVPHVDEITSLVNARDTRGEGDVLHVGDLLEDWPTDEAELAALRERVMHHPLYRNMVVSEDGRLTTIVIRSDTYSSLTAGGELEEAPPGDEQDGFDDIAAGFDDADAALEGFADDAAPAPAYLTDAENSAMVQAVKRVVARHRSEDLDIRLAGTPVLTDTLKRAMMRDMRRFMAVVLLVIAASLWLMFRRLSGMLLPLLVVILSVVSTFGLMAVLGAPFKLPHSILPSFLLAVGVGAAVHVMAMFFHYLEGDENRVGAAARAMGHSGLAIVITSLTTAVGLASFAGAEVDPISKLGIFSSVGILFSLLYTLVLLPALLAICPIRARAPRAGDTPRMDRLLRAVGTFATRRWIPILAVSGVLFVLVFTGMAQLRFRHNVLGWLPETLPDRQAIETLDEEMRGTVAMEVAIDTGRENGLHDREVLTALDRLAAEFAAYDEDGVFVGKTLSVADLLKEIHQALNENDPAYYAIPENERLIPQEFLLFENSGSDDLEDLVDSGFRKARFSIRVPWKDAFEYLPLLDRVETRFDEELGAQAEITVTGMITVLVRTMTAAVHSAGRSYVIALVVITILMILLIGRLKLGLVSMLPNLFAIFATMGIMGWFDIPLDMFTMLIASIAIGLAVDDTIHFLHNFRRYHLESGDVVAAVHESLHTAGRAMLVTSIVLALGFFCFTGSSLQHLTNFGLLTAIAVIFALLGNFLMAPALMVAIHPRPRNDAKEVSP